MGSNDLRSISVRREAHAPFFQGILGPVAASETAGRDDKLCAALARYLDSDAGERPDG